MKHNKARRIIARRGYAQKRIAALRRKMQNNILRFYRICNHLTAFQIIKESAAFDRAQKRIAGKIRWYSTIVIPSADFAKGITLRKR